MGEMNQPGTTNAESAEDYRRSAEDTTDREPWVFEVED
jgi:hypothetical protein